MPQVDFVSFLPFLYEIFLLLLFFFISINVSVFFSAIIKTKSFGLLIENIFISSV